MPRPPADSPLLNPDLIAEVALRRIDEGGLEALSMRKLAAELKVTPRSLYHYVPTKDALLREVYVRVLSELELPTEPGNEQDWRENLRGLARSFRALSHRHPSFAPYFLGGHEPLERDTYVFEVLYGLLLQAGLPAERVTTVGRALVSFWVGFILAELAGTFAQTRLAAQRTLVENEPERYPTLQSLPLPQTPPDDAFEEALELLLTGVSASVETQDAL